MFKQFTETLNDTWADIRKVVWDDNRKEIAKKNTPPANAISILCPDGRVYMKIWHAVEERRICMEFASMPGVWMKWYDEALPDTINALVKLLAERPPKPPKLEPKDGMPGDA